MSINENDSIPELNFDGDKLMKILQYARKYIGLQAYEKRELDWRGTLQEISRIEDMLMRSYPPDATD